MNKTKRGTVTANFSKSRIDLNNIVWVKTGKTVHWPGQKYVTFLAVFGSVTVLSYNKATYLGFPSTNSDGNKP